LLLAFGFLANSQKLKAKSQLSLNAPLGNNHPPVYQKASHGRFIYIFMDIFVSVFLKKLFIFIIRKVSPKVKL